MKRHFFQIKFLSPYLPPCPCFPPFFSQLEFHFCWALQAGLGCQAWVACEQPGSGTTRWRPYWGGAGSTHLNRVSTQPCPRMGTPPDLTRRWGPAMSLLEDRRVSWVPLSESGSGTDAESIWTPINGGAPGCPTWREPSKLEGCLKKREEAHGSF